MIRLINLILVFIFFSSCDKKSNETKHCENSIVYEFVGIVDKDSLNSIPVDLEITALGYEGVLTINNCKGDALLKLFDNNGNVIVSGEFLGGEVLEKIESDWISSDVYDTQIDTVEVYKTYISGNWNFKKVKVKIGGETIK